LLLTVQAAPQAQRTPCRADTNLVGTWRVVEFAGEQRPESYAAHKHVTPTHFAVIHWDPAAASTASLVHSGTYAG
jgi:hypothetical protein